MSIWPREDKLLPFCHHFNYSVSVPIFPYVDKGKVLPSSLNDRVQTYGKHQD
jgi:hypothetical protein